MNTQDENKLATAKLSEHELHVCRVMKIGHAAFLATKERMARGEAGLTPLPGKPEGAPITRIRAALALELGLAQGASAKEVAAELAARAKRARSAGRGSTEADWKRIAEALATIERAFDRLEL